MILKHIKTTLFVSCLTALPLISISASAAEPVSFETEEFSCADSIQNLIPLLGRGTNFPQFVAKDVESELKRQAKRSVLKKITCTGEPQVQAGTVDVDNNGKTEKALDTLSVTFPLLVHVQHRKSKIALVVNQNYTVENLLSEHQQKTTQNFTVISQQDMN